MRPSLVIRCLPAYLLETSPSYFPIPFCASQKTLSNRPKLFKLIIYSDPSPLRGSLIADSLFRGFSKAPADGPKRRKMLPISDKVKLLDMLREGKSYAAVAHHYGINESSVRYIKKEEKT